MGNLRIKLKYKSFEIELEGDKETVQSEFKDIKQNGLGNIVMGIDMADDTYYIETKPNSPINIPKNEIMDISNEEYPNIKDVLMKQLPSSEPEWILVYSFYGSDFGNKPFTNGTIQEGYNATKRNTKSRKANLSNNIKSLFNKGLFSALNDEEFILTADGKHQAKEIVTRSHSIPIKQEKPTSKDKANKKPQKSNGKSSSQKFSIIKELNLRPTDKIDLIKYMEGFEIKSNADRIIVIVNYLKEILSVDQVTIDHLYTAFFELKCKIPTSFYQVVINTKSRDHLLDFEKVDNINLSVQGMNRVRLDITRK
jgi:hypothetical protein